MSVWPSVKQLAEDVNAGSVSAVKNVEKSLELIEKHKEFESIIATTEERALERAHNIDELIKSGKNAGRLAGVPFIAKDNFLVFGAETTAASNILKGFNAPYQATAIEKLEAEGAICVAKANLDAFAHGGSTENSDFMVTKNPHDKSRVPGGSSGGSAAAAALQLAPFALGTDTGGSIRQPASFTGVVGLKPSYGLVSRNGVVAMASSTDVIGPIANTVEDTAFVLDVMAGQDPLDSTTVPRQEDYTDLNPSLKGKKIGVIKEYFAEGLSDDVKKVVNDAIEKLKAAGADVEEVSLPTLPSALAVYYIIMPAEVSSNLARYDGQRYGHSKKDSKDIDESYELARAEGFGAEAKRRIMIGAYVLSSGYYDAYYKKAQTVRTKIVEDFKKAFNKFDLLVGPVAPTAAFKIGEKSDPLSMYLSDVLTVGANIAGIPSISVPAGKSDGMPVGLQIMAAQNLDKELLSAALAFEGLQND